MNPAGGGQPIFGGGSGTSIYYRDDANLTVTIMLWYSNVSWAGSSGPGCTNQMPTRPADRYE